MVLEDFVQRPRPPVPYRNPLHVCGAFPVKGRAGEGVGLPDGTLWGGKGKGATNEGLPPSPPSCLLPGSRGGKGGRTREWGEGEGGTREGGSGGAASALTHGRAARACTHSTTPPSPNIHHPPPAPAGSTPTPSPPTPPTPDADAASNTPGPRPTQHRLWTGSNPLPSAHDEIKMHCDTESWPFLNAAKSWDPNKQGCVCSVSEDAKTRVNQDPIKII